MGVLFEELEGNWFVYILIGILNFCGMSNNFLRTRQILDAIVFYIAFLLKARIELATEKTEA